jgi:hypothetical protein
MGPRRGVCQTRSQQNNATAAVVALSGETRARLSGPEAERRKEVQGMDAYGSAVDLLRGWWWIIALVVIFAVVYRVGAGGSGSPSPASYGCLVAMVVSALFFVFVIL